MIMEIVNIEAGAFMEMNDILFKIEKQLKGLSSSKSELNEWLDNQDVCILMNISDRKLLSLRQKGLIPFSRIDRKIYYKKEDILGITLKHIQIMEMGQQVLNKDSNEVKRFIEVMEGISKMLNANSLIYRPILDGNRYITEQELSKALKITKRTLIEYRMNGKLPYYKIGGKILYKEQDIIDILERNKVLAFE
jgi:DNA-binding transcriptional MerR regulator